MNWDLRICIFGFCVNSTRCASVKGVGKIYWKIEKTVFVVDLCISEKELAGVKSALLDTIKELPDNTNVGLITYNRYVNVYELASKLNMIYCINSEKEYSLQQAMDILGVQYKN